MIKRIYLLLLALAPQIANADPLTKYQHLPTDVADMPFFDTEAQAQQRTDEYNSAIDAINDALDTCEEALCETLTQHQADLEYAIDDHQEKNGASITSWLGGPAYTPEVGLMVAAGGLFSFSTNREQQALQRSSVSLFAVGTQGDAGFGYGIRSKQNLFFDHNNTRFTGALTFSDDAENYWGVGYDKGKAQDSSADTLMRNTSLTYDANLSFKNNYGFYFGPVLRLKYYQADKGSIPLAAEQDENFNAFKDRPLSIGLGITLNHDSRDVTVNAWQGQYFNVEYINYGSKIGSDNNYQKVLIDYRYYHSFNPGRVIAFYNALQWSDGEVPFYDMPTLGGSFSLRGLYAGRFRDNNAVEHTAEYRHTFLRDNGNLSAHGMTVWGGFGSVTSNLDTNSSSLYEDLLYSYGLGYRYELQPRMNVRIDVGFSADDSGFFLTFTEAF
ncbi:MAG: BamA/TamA family outer membrane protein [Moritella sp.]|uniref:BamA/TamA family outer membrane protein n=1 Tax=Moritella sp. TaxID=78556 RepID=UPI0029B6151D|nr:BamA/TamA family outer membrane protein [Moritella sp.]MDX2320006.1 BamA/TamA family outer membrane protein [Moritella sp.]